MAPDYPVFDAVRQQFGDDPTGAIGVKGQDFHECSGQRDLPFVGLAKDHPFGRPSIDGSQRKTLVPISASRRRHEGGRS